MAETIGQQLKKAREERNLTLKQVVEELHIREAYLQAMEEDHLESHLPSVQAKGFLRLYADFLDITPYEAVSLSEVDTTAKPTETSKVSQSEEIIKDELQEPSSKTEISPQIREVVEQIKFGNQFTKVREEKSLTFSNVEHELHVSRDYIKAIEEEDFKALPQGIQGRGMIQRYADFLALDTDDILNQYADLLLENQPDATNDKKKRKQARKVNGVKQFLTTDLLIGLVFVFALFIVAFFSIRWVISTRNIMVTNEPTAESVVLTQTLTPNLEGTTGETIEGTSVPVEIATATLQIRPTGENEGNTSSRIILQIIANQRAYLRVTSDGETVFDGRIVGGNIYEFYGEEKIEIMSGNAAALNVTVIQDGRQTQLGILGVVGQVVNLAFQPDVIITPTVTPSLTPTVTNTPEATKTPTVTASPTITEAP